ncbi:MAG: TonB-dependent receptor, partial [Bacteroidetes bacterium]|nr:TonB-dependent receptor [Bacteroidota bacterium]
HPENLGQRDIYIPIERQAKGVKIISGSRFPIEAADLPFSVHIITKEEIRQNSYETLVDALKMAPGIRVSQPGNAIEGETFLMRGLPGNTYTKILINDVPVKPSFVAGLPIGAQLPIREAERIEVIYGAGAALYGADASAGVINIITRQSEKPVFMQADLGVGQGLYSGVNVMFGGRLGRDKHIFKYFAYGSNVLLEHRNIFYDKDFNYNPLTYSRGGQKVDSQFVALPNYAGTSASDPILTNTPHLSRKFGVTLNYRSLSLSVESMYRRDHSSIGLNPLSVSYRNPLTYTGEGMWRFNFNFFRNKEKRNQKTDLTYIRYRLDDRSSILLVRNQLADEFYLAADAKARSLGDTSLLPELFAKSYGEYLNGSRYLFGQSDELRLEHVRNFRILKIFSLTAGANGKVALGYPFTGLLARPPSEDANIFANDIQGFGFDTLTFPIRPEFHVLAEGNAFGQIFYNGKYFNIAAGINNSFYTSAIDRNDVADSLKVRDNEWSPRLAGVWKISESINLRSSWGQSYRAPNEFYRSNSYIINSGAPRLVWRPYRALSAEKTTSWESGIRLKRGDHVGFEFTWFSNQTSNLINLVRRVNNPKDSTVYSSFLGFLNARNASVRFRGGQVVSNFRLVLGNESRWADVRYNFSWIKAEIKDDSTGGTITLPQISGRTHQLRLTVHPLKNTTFVFDFLRQTKAGQAVGLKPDKGYTTLDFVARYAFTERFDAYLKIINVFDKEYAGIPASWVQEDNLHYNPQSGIFVRLGMNYYLE